MIATVRTLLFARQADLIRSGLDAKLRIMFNLAPIAMALLDRGFKYESVNPAYSALTGYSAEELIGQPGDLVVAAGSVIPEVESLSNLAPGAHWTGRVSVERKDGSFAEVEWQVARERISGVRILIASDITRQLQSEKPVSSYWKANARPARRRNAATG